jgi:hypothetical protein
MAVCVELPCQMSIKAAVESFKTGGTSAISALKPVVTLYGQTMDQYIDSLKAIDKKEQINEDLKKDILFELIKINNSLTLIKKKIGNF